MLQTHEISTNIFYEYIRGKKTDGISLSNVNKDVDVDIDKCISFYTYALIWIKM